MVVVAVRDYLETSASVRTKCGPDVMSLLALSVILMQGVIPDHHTNDGSAIVSKVDVLAQSWLHRCHAGLLSWYQGAGCSVCVVGSHQPPNGCRSMRSAFSGSACTAGGLSL